jgi:hypothetical protein
MKGGRDASLSIAANNVTCSPDLADVNELELPLTALLAGSQHPHPRETIWVISVDVEDLHQRGGIASVEVPE